MDEQTRARATQDSDAPSRKRDVDLATRYGVSKRTGGEMLRTAVAAGVAKKLGGKKHGLTVARWTALDAFVANGCQVPARTRGGR